MALVKRRTVSPVALSAVLMALGCSDGTGSAPSTCGPRYCAGCCSDGVCQPGNVSSACGVGGAACVDCQGQGCQPQTGICAGACVPNCTAKCAGEGDGCGGICSTNSCQGCCQGSQCLDGTNDFACGTAGQACRDCVLSGQTCSMAGACGGGVKLDGGGAVKLDAGGGVTPDGGGGDGCGACEPYEFCDKAKQACVIDPGSQWQVVLAKASIDCSSKVFDPMALANFKKPDPFVNLKHSVPSGDCLPDFTFPFVTIPYQDTCEPAWYIYYKEGQKIVFSASEVVSSWCLRVGDMDTPLAEDIGRCSVPISATDLKQGSKRITSCPNQKDGKNYILSLQLNFAHWTP